MSKKKEKECAGFEKPVPKGFHPITLYHVTVNLDKVCYEGFKSAIELEKEAKKRKTPIPEGVGGGTVDTISTTYDPNLAEDYFEDIITISKIANGTVTPKNICKYLDKHDYSEKITQSPCEIWQSLDNMENTTKYSGFAIGGLKQLEQGNVPNNKDMFNIFKELTPEEGDKWGLGTDKKQFANKWMFELSEEQRIKMVNHFLFEKASPEVIQEQLKNWWYRGYLKERSNKKGRQDPIFMNINLKKYQKNPSKIGIVKLKGYLPRPLEDYLGYIKRHNEFYDPQYGFPDDHQYKGKFMIMEGESEIRLTPDWYNQLKIIKRGK